MTEPEIQPQEGLHNGHRQRMAETFLARGAEAFSDLEMLEMLLTFALPRIDTKPMARNLLAYFGTLYRVLSAPYDQLRRVRGVGPHAALLIRFLESLWFRREKSRTEKHFKIETINDAGKYLVARLGDYTEERAFLLCLDNSFHILDFQEISRGATSSVGVTTRRVVETAVRCSATVAILAHNHINGTAMPSMEDVNYTVEAQKALKMVDVVLVDHIIVCGDDYVSMKSSQMINVKEPQFKE